MDLSVIQVIVVPKTLFQKVTGLVVVVFPFVEEEEDVSLLIPEVSSVLQ